MSVASTAAQAIIAIAQSENANALRVVTDIPRQRVMDKLGVNNPHIEEVTLHDTRVIVTNDAEEDYGKALPNYLVSSRKMNVERQSYLRNQNTRLALLCAVLAVWSLVSFVNGYLNPEIAQDMWIMSLWQIMAIFTMATCAYAVLALIQRLSAIVRHQRECVRVQRVSYVRSASEEHSSRA